MRERNVRKVDHPYIIDVEASGFGGFSYPIEIGVAMEKDNRYCALISPAPDWTHWDAEAEKVHQITRDNLDNNGRPLREVTSELNELLYGITVYTDGWVVDKPWLSTLFYAAHCPMKFYVSPLELILSEYQMEVWYTTKRHVIEETDIPRHRASHDAWVIQETYKRTLIQNQK
jgi:hypothetical protein